jgi:CBS domain-containing protein
MAMPLNPAQTESTAVRVRTRRTLASNGRMLTTSSVDCLRLAREMPLDACLNCERFQKLGSTQDAQHAAVHCRALDGPGGTPLDQPLSQSESDSVAHRSQADRTPISVIVTTDVVCVREDVSLDAVAALLLEFGISGVPVVDACGVPVGMVSHTDLVRRQYENANAGWVGPNLEKDPTGLAWSLGAGFHEEPAPTRTARDVMLGGVFTLSENATIAEAAALMVHECVHRVPVTCADGKVVGMVSMFDVLRWLVDQNGDRVRQ